MKFPNLRYGNPEALRYYTIGQTKKQIARRLRRSERSVHDWMNGKKRMPWWIEELLRLQEMERVATLRQMGFAKVAPRLGIVSADVLRFPERLAPVAEPAPEPFVDMYTLPLFVQA